MARLLRCAVLAGGAASLWVICGCGGGATSDTPPRVAVLVMENKEAGTVLGDRHAPYLNSLARRYAVADRSYGLRHPSLPNYIALVAGTTADITTDCLPQDCSSDVRSIVDQLEDGGHSWRGYMESMPSPCFHLEAEERGGYAQRHNPFAYLSRVWSKPSRCRNVVPLSQLPADADRGLPRFSFISPNLCHDMHDCSVGTGDAWLRQFVPPLLQALGSRGLLILTFDEGESDRGCCNGSTGGRIATILAGSGARKGARDMRPVDHYSTLATIEDVLGLPRLGRAKTAPTLTPLLDESRLATP